MEKPMADGKLKQQQQQQQQPQMVSVPYYDFFTPDGKPKKLGNVQINKSLPFYHFRDPTSVPQAVNIDDKLYQLYLQHNQMNVVGQNRNGGAASYRSVGQFGG